MSTLLNLTGQLDKDTVVTLSHVNDVATHLNIPYIVVGATARDLILHYGYGASVQRATSDIDFAIQVDSWASFEAVKQALYARNFTETSMQHRLNNSTGKPIDIVPFGAQVQNDSTIAWPPNGDVVMNVMGFQEACDHAQSVIIRETPYLACPVVTPEGFAILKLIAWQDRSQPSRLKDASDIGYLFSVFRHLDSFIEELYSDNNIADLERYDWDTDLAACFLLGKNCKTIATDEIAAEILKLRHNPLSEYMASSNILTVRLNQEALIKLDELARLQNRSRSQLVQDAVRDLIHSSDELNQQEFQRLKARLAPAVKAQCALLEKSSVADEHRRF